MKTINNENKRCKFELNRDCEIIKFFMYKYDGDVEDLNNMIPNCEDCDWRNNCSELYSKEEGIKSFIIVANNLLDVGIEIAYGDFNSLMSYIDGSNALAELSIICKKYIKCKYEDLPINLILKLEKFVSSSGYNHNSRIIINVMNYLFLRNNSSYIPRLNHQEMLLASNKKRLTNSFLDEYDEDEFYFEDAYYNRQYYYDDFMYEMDEEFQSPRLRAPIGHHRHKANREADDIYENKDCHDEIQDESKEDKYVSKNKKFTYDTSPILEDFIGLNNVKEQLQQLRNRLQFEKALGNGFNFGNRLLHTAFVGNPGVGKSMIGKEYARILYEFGYIKENKVVFAKKGDLIGEYIGHTPGKTQSTIDKSLGGVLFIDEAYTLKPRGEKDFAHECIEILIANMTEKVDELVVIFAGYKDEIFEFFKSNPGIESRVPNILEFEDYSNEELLDIMKLKLRNFNTNGQDSSGFKMTKSLEDKLLSLFQMKRNSRSFGNARFAENILNKMLDTHANYCCENNIYEREALLTLDENCINPYINEPNDMFLDKNQNDKIKSHENDEIAI